MIGNINPLQHPPCSESHFSLCRLSVLSPWRRTASRPGTGSCPPSPRRRGPGWRTSSGSATTGGGGWAWGWGWAVATPSPTPWVGTTTRCPRCRPSSCLTRWATWEPAWRGCSQTSPSPTQPSVSAQTPPTSLMDWLTLWWVKRKLNRQVYYNFLFCFQNFWPIKLGEAGAKWREISNCSQNTE